LYCKNIEYVYPIKAIVVLITVFSLNLKLT